MKYNNKINHHNNSIISNNDHDKNINHCNNNSNDTQVIHIYINRCLSNKQWEGCNVNQKCMVK